MTVQIAYNRLLQFRRFDSTTVPLATFQAVEIGLGTTCPRSALSLQRVRKHASISVPSSISRRKPLDVAMPRAHPTLKRPG